jgi:hypothetical protein
MTVRFSPDISNPLDIALKLQQVAVKHHHFAVLAFLYSLIKLLISLILRRRCGKVSSMHCLLRILSVEKLKFNVQYSGMNLTYHPCETSPLSSFICTSENST